MIPETDDPESNLPPHPDSVPPGAEHIPAPVLAEVKQIGPDANVADFIKQREPQISTKIAATRAKQKALIDVISWLPADQNVMSSTYWVFVMGTGFTQQVAAIPTLCFGIDALQPHPDAFDYKDNRRLWCPPH